MSLSLRFQLKTQTQNSFKMSNSDSKLTENELLNSKLKPKTHRK